MAQLHEVLMKHHFSLAKVEAACIEALKDECLEYVQSVNKAELMTWKGTCQNLHMMLDVPVTGFTIKVGIMSIYFVLFT